MPASKNSFLDHLKWFRKAALSAGAEGFVALDNCQAYLRQGQRQMQFFPQFQASIDGQLQYQHVLTEDASMFAGWLPYRMKRWETAADKLAFKRFAQAAGLKTPRSWLLPDPEAVNVVVKSARSSFGQQVLGPFRDGPAEHPLDLARGEYYEEFVEGWLLKIWYWNAQPVCAEMDATPSVRGDGLATLRQLVMRRASQQREPSEAERRRLLTQAAGLFKYYGRNLDTVLPAGRRQMIEYRYGSSLMAGGDRRVLDLAAGEAPPWLGQAAEAGAALHGAIPADIRKDTLFTVDAILPRDGMLRLLECNCNPTVHPLLYPAMASTLLAAPAAEALH